MRLQIFGVTSGLLGLVGLGFPLLWIALARGLPVPPPLPLPKADGLVWVRPSPPPLPPFPVDALHQARQERARRWAQGEPPVLLEALPEALLSASASGVDPHLPLEALWVQLPRLAKERGVPFEALQTFFQTWVATHPLPFLVILFQADLDEFLSRRTSSPSP